MASFLSLPAELRAEIYEIYIQVLANDEEVDPVTFHLDVATWSCIAQDKRFLPRLCHASRQVRDEFLPLWASHLTFAIDLSAVQYRSEQRYVLDFLHIFGESLVAKCKNFALPFCRMVLQGKRDVAEGADTSGRGNTFLVIVWPHEDVNVGLLRGLLMQRLRDMVEEGHDLSGRDVREIIFGPLRATGKSYVKWDPDCVFDEYWRAGSCLRSRQRGC